MDNQNVPKFGSFRPKPPPAEAHHEREKSSSHRSSHRDRDGHRDHTHQSHLKESDKRDTYSGSRSRSKTSPQPRSRHIRHDELRTKEHRGRVPLEDYTNEVNAVYVIDRRGDRDNVTYGSINRYKVPPYRRYGGGCVLGLPPDMRIDRSLTTDKDIYIIPTGGHWKERPFARKPGRKHDSEPVQLLKPAPDSGSGAGVNLDFIPVGQSRKRKRGEVTPAGDSFQIFDVESASEEEVSDSQIVNPLETSGITVISEVAQKNSSLTNRTRLHPEDLGAWLDLIDHQEAVLVSGRSVISPDLSTSDQRSLAEIRISIYEQALRSIGTNKANKIRLHLGLMAEASKFWENSKLTKKWEDLVFKYPKSADIWIKYLDFIQTKFVDFTYETCRAAFRKAFESLCGPDQDDPSLFLYLMLRLTTLMREAGYQEQAVATWQAVIEFHILRPESGAKSDFEEFWESEVPRIGEPEAEGWRNSDPHAPTYPAPGSILLKPKPDVKSRFQSFYLHELDHMSKLRLPGRTTDDVGDDDPYHIVLFSDISEWLPRLPENLSGLDLVQAFLCFHHLPPLPDQETSHRSWWLDPFLQGNHLDVSRFRPVETLEPNYVGRSILELLSEFSACHIHNFEMTLELLFSQGFQVGLDSIDASFVRCALKLLATYMRDDRIASYLLAFELRYFPSEVVKTAKQLLKAHQSSLPLYNAYGLVEFYKGNNDKADLVFRTALSMNKNSDIFGECGGLDIYESWVWAALHQGKREEALRRLVSPHGDVPDWEGRLDAAAILRARTLLTSHFDQSLGMRNYAAAVKANSLLSLLVYLTNDLSLAAAISVHGSLTTYFTSHNLTVSSVGELYAQSLVRLLSLHLTLSPIHQPAHLRSILESQLFYFPENTLVLSLYAANEARFRLDDRVRCVVAEVLNANGRKRKRSIVGWLWAVWYECMRWKRGSGTLESVRGVLKRACQSAVGSECAALWNIWVHLEMEEFQREKRKLELRLKERRGLRSGGRGEHDTDTDRDRETKQRERKGDEEMLNSAAGKLKDVFFQGLTHLPWCKAYIMLAFGELREVLRDEEMERCAKVLLEKEIRVYCEIED